MRAWVIAGLMLSVSGTVFSGTSIAEDWPQWMGAKRDNVWREKGIIKKFPAGGPKVVWKTAVAGGYAGPCVADGRVYVTDYVTSDNVKVANFERVQFSGIERILCLSEATGKEIWKHEYPVKYGMSYPAGPRCTPNVHQGKVYTLGAEGHLICFTAKTGKVLWSKHLPKDYNTKAPLWGYAAHPLIDGQNLICLAGGQGSHAVAFDKDSGKEIWRAVSSAELGYTPPIIMEVAGVRQLILFYPEGVASLNPKTGAQYWSQEYEASNGSTIMTPVRSGNLLYVGGFNKKNMLLELSQDRPGAKTVWRDLPRAGIAAINVQPFVVGKTLYGFDQTGYLMAMEMATGKRIWQSTLPLSSERPKGSGTAFIIKNGEYFWMFNELGELMITKLSTKGYEEIDRVKVIKPTSIAFGRDVVWSPPAWANRKVYLRNDEECICIDLAK